MLADAQSLYVAREDDLAALLSHLDAARNGSPRVVRLQAPFGGGRRASIRFYLPANDRRSRRLMETQ